MHRNTKLSWVVILKEMQSEYYSDLLPQGRRLPRIRSVLLSVFYLSITKERMWRKRPDGIAVKMPRETKSEEFCILEFKRMSDVTDQCTVYEPNKGITTHSSDQLLVVM